MEGCQVGSWVHVSFLIRSAGEGKAGKDRASIELSAPQGRRFMVATEVLAAERDRSGLPDLPGGSPGAAPSSLRDQRPFQFFFLKAVFAFWVQAVTTTRAGLAVARGS